MKWIINVVQSNEQLNRECSLFTDDARYVIVGSAAHIPDELRPHFYQVTINSQLFFTRLFIASKKFDGTLFFQDLF